MSTQFAHEPRIAPLTPTDIEAVRALAHRVWHRHYPSIISPKQIDYMLAQRYAVDVIADELTRDNVWWHKCERGARIVGFSSCVTAERADELKLDKLYVDNDVQRGGVGAGLIDNALALAARLGKARLILAVNKNNTQAINAYLKHGFTVRESIVKDIGQGFVMDDFIMTRDAKA
jgi:diamine N-acetyltransferase